MREFSSCTVTPMVDPALCAAAVPLEPGMPRLAQDSARGGYGECATSGSGMGGPSLYYRITVPADRKARIEMIPSTAGADGLVRVLEGCGAAMTTMSGRGGMLTQGEAAVCLENAGTAPQEYVVAVSRYSGETGCLPIAFDVSIELRPRSEPCFEIE